MAILLLVVLLGVSACNSSKEQEKLAVADAFGGFKSLLLNANYEAAYEMMSKEFKSGHSLTSFQARDEHGAMTRTFTNCDWSLGGKVLLSGTQAEVQIQYNPSFGTSFKFVKEDGVWRFTGQTSVFEKLDL